MAILKIKFDTHRVGFDAEFDAMLLLIKMAKLDTLAVQNGLTPLMSFYEFSREDLAAFADSFDIRGGIDDMRSSMTTRWFRPEAGIKAVRDLIEFLEANPDAIGRSEQVVAVLNDVKRILGLAADAGHQWHFG